MRTPAEINDEIAKLKELKSKIPARNFFGGNNHEKIEAAIRVLEEDLDFDDIDDEYDPEDNHELYSDARDAREWADGDSDEAPSTGWSELVKQ